MGRLAGELGRAREASEGQEAGGLGSARQASDRGHSEGVGAGELEMAQVATAGGGVSDATVAEGSRQVSKNLAGRWNLLDRVAIQDGNAIELIGWSIVVHDVRLPSGLDPRSFGHGLSRGSHQKSISLEP